MDLNTMSNWAEIISVIIVIGGFSFAVMQLHQFILQRRALATLELARSFQNPEFTHAMRLILSLEPKLSAKEIRAKGGEYEDAAMLVALTVESVGIMVHRRMVSITMVWELMGGLLLSYWEHMEPWILDIRKEQGRDKFNEWAQWLAIQLSMLDNDKAFTPAFEKHKDWRPNIIIF